MQDTPPPFFPESLSIESARLRIRPLVREDGEALSETAASPMITQAVYILRDGLTPDGARDLIAMNSATSVLCGIRLTTNDTLVGAFRLHRHEYGAVELGYWLDVDWQGRGFAKEALSSVLSYLRTHPARPQIIAECDPTNGPSNAILLSAGFRRTGEDGKRPGRKRYEYS